MDGKELAGRLSQYEAIVRRIKPTNREIDIRNRVMQLIQEDGKLSPFFSGERWYNRFESTNKKGSCNLKDAPVNQLLMVITDSVDTLYSLQDRGTGILRGSILIKLDKDVVYCMDSFYWYASQGGPITYSVKGFFTYGGIKAGKVKPLSSVIV